MYFNFLFAGINTLVVTYYLAIEKAPILKEVFPSFPIYVAIAVIIGIPVLVITGFIHYKRVSGYKAEAEISTESNPYLYKVPPGYWKEVIIPYDLMISKILIKLSNNDKLNTEEINEIGELQKKMEHLSKGGYVGIPKGKKLPFKLESED